MVGFASEVLDTLNRSVVLTHRSAQFDTDPFAGRERGGAVETDETSAHRNIYDATYHWLGHGRRPVVAERSKLSCRSIDDRKWSSKSFARCMGGAATLLAGPLS